ncbi:MAG: aldehyde:ferredoxin oxidoreductase, partial [Methanomicrobia archaeon]|nr:aldehyde:ferredoxin oxidoreductase [Methanomicrobia archaeon]
KIGERIINLERLYNFEEGLSVKDDALPERFFTEKTSRGYLIDRTKFKKMLDEYYKLSSWKDGKP